MIVQDLISVPQGSVLGPLLFTLFSTPLGDIATRFRLRFYQYADDIKTYIAIRRDNIACVTSRLAACTAAVYEWFLHNRLALNPDKSEAAMYGTLAFAAFEGKHVYHDCPCACWVISQYKKSWCTIDENLTFDEHVRNVCKAPYYRIRDLRHIRAAMSKYIACTVASAIVGSRLD